MIALRVCDDSSELFRLRCSLRSFAREDRSSLIATTEVSRWWLDVDQVDLRHLSQRLEVRKQWLLPQRQDEVVVVVDIADELDRTIDTDALTLEMFA